MLILSNILSKASGSMGGITAAHNRGGMYLRNRSTPVNPNSSFQQEVRNAMKTLAARWSNSLTQAQRDAWAVYTENQLFTNRLGEARSIPPLSAYQRVGVPRLQGPGTIIDDAPTNFTLPPFTDPVFTISEAAGNISIAFTTTDAWVNENNGAMVIYASRPQSVGKQYFRGPYRLVTFIGGDAATPPTSPQVNSGPFSYIEDDIVFLRVRIMTADNRLSTDRFYRHVVTA